MRAAIHIYLAGDSTMCCYDESVAPRAGWGTIIQKATLSKGGLFVL
ncbi:MAG: hypothetical protein K0Q73_2691 [Paenibacillus sp.]|jgi:hypothetical protein|nr:hypothetical protein [Paenibacillus sp.]